MTKKAKESWLFVDLDGTLAQSLPRLRKSFSDLGRRYDLVLTDQDFSAVNGSTMTEIAAYLKRKGQIGQSINQLAAEYLVSVQKVYARLRPTAGARQAFDKLSTEGWKLALVTSAPLAIAKPFLRANQLEQHFSFIVSGEEVRRGKPHPDIYRLAVKRAGAGYYVALEDSVNGLVASRTAGCLTLHFQPTASRPAFWAIRSFSELAERLTRVNGTPLLVWRTNQPSGFTLAPGGIALPFNAKVNQFWKTACARNPKLFEGQNLCLSTERAPAQFLGGLVPYRYIHYQRQTGRSLGFIAGAVTGIVQQGRDLILAERSSEVSNATYAGKSEWVPAGGASRQFLHDKRFDHRGQLLEEMAEELGITEKDILSIDPWGLSLDLTDRALDIVSAIKVSPKARLRLSGEHRQLKRFTVTALRRALKHEPQCFIPAVHAICRRWLTTERRIKQ